MMFGLTPIVVQVRSPLVASISTRVTAPVAVQPSRMRTLKSVRWILRSCGYDAWTAARRAESMALTWTVALVGAHLAVLPHPHLDRRFGGEVTGRQFVGDHPHALDVEVVLLPARRPAHQQLQREASAASK